MTPELCDVFYFLSPCTVLAWTQPPEAIFTICPGKEGIIPGKEGTIPGKEGIIPGKEGIITEWIRSIL